MANCGNSGLVLARGKGHLGPHLVFWFSQPDVWCRAQLPLARRSGSAQHYDRGFGHVLNPLQGESNWSYINLLIQDLGSEVDRSNMLKGQ